MGTLRLEHFRRLDFVAAACAAVYAASVALVPTLAPLATLFASPAAAASFAGAALVRWAYKIPAPEQV